MMSSLGAMKIQIHLMVLSLGAIDASDGVTQGCFCWVAPPNTEFFQLQLCIGRCF